MANINISRLAKYNSNKFMIHSADAKLTLNHIDFWLNEITKVNDDFSILVRDEENYKKLVKKYPRLQILYAKTPVDVETVVNIQPDLKVVLFTSNLARNIHLLRFNHLKHIFIGTKNSDWLSNFNKSYRAYDEVWASGKFIIKRLKEEIGNIGHLKFKIIGKPQIKEILLNHPIDTNSSLILVEGNERLIEMIYYSHYINNLKMYIYIHKDKKAIKQNLYNVAKTHNINNLIRAFDTKELVDEFILKSSYIVTDLKNLSPYLLPYRLPIFVYLEDKNDKYKVTPEVLQEVVYFWSDKEELNNLLKNIKDNDELKSKREELLDNLFNIDATLNDMFFLSLKNEINDDNI